MALIPLYFVVADHYPVAAGQEIIEGQWVKQNTDGDIVICDTAGENALGIAGDTKSTSVSGLPTLNAATIGGGDTPGTPVVSTKQFVNRASDSYDETKASGRITVYHSGGKFATDKYGTIISTPGLPLYVNTSGNLTTTSAGAAVVVARLTKAPADYPSGVPGTDVNGSITLGSYLEFKMVE